ncbi:MAG TPA: hypothetical protein VLT45_16050 [Kofleriaceae bacterium]|nr:hypothetical protein [Kofleriaceae bacterium]
MSDLRVSFPVIDASSSEGHTSLDARSFRQAALALATGKLPRHMTQPPVYIVAPERRRWLGPVLVAAAVAAALAVLLVWLL